MTVLGSITHPEPSLLSMSSRRKTSPHANFLTSTLLVD
jgi:hypothetical protein